METVSHFFSFYTYLQQIWRKLKIQRVNRQVMATNAPSILCLPDDVLFMIFDQLQENDRQPLPVRRLALYAACRKHKPRQCPQNQNTNGHEGDFIRFSASNRRIRGLARAKILRTISLGTSWSPERASKALTNLSQCPHASAYVRELRLDIWDAGDLVVGVEKTTTQAAKNLLKFSHQFLAAARLLDNVQKIKIAVPASTAFALHYAFRLDVSAEAGIQLPNVKELDLSPFMHWIIDFCPNVRSVKSNDWVVQSGVARHDQVQAIIEAAGRAPFLEHLALHCRWRLELLQQVVEQMPGLESLDLRGGDFAPDMNYMLSVLQRMEKLETLRLPKAPQAGHILGLDGWYLSLGETSTFHHQVVTKKVFRELQHLEELCLGGGFRARMLNRELNQIEVRWESSRSQQHPHGSTYQKVPCTMSEDGKALTSCPSECTLEQELLQELSEEDQENIRGLRFLEDEPYY